MFKMLFLPSCSQNSKVSTPDEGTALSIIVSHPLSKGNLLTTKPFLSNSTRALCEIKTICLNTGFFSLLGLTFT